MPQGLILAAFHLKGSYYKSARKTQLEFVYNIQFHRYIDFENSRLD